MSRHPARWVAAGVGITLLAVAAIIAGAVAHRAPAKTTPVQSVHAVKLSVVAHSTRLGGDEVAVAIRHDAVFAQSGRNRIVRLDPVTLHVTGARAVDGRHGSILTLLYGASSLWVLDQSANRLLRIDPTTLQVLQRTDVRRTHGLAFGDGSIWVSLTQRASAHKWRDALERIDPATGRVTGHTILAGTNASEIVVGRDVVAVASWQGPNIQLINPTTMRIARTLPSRGTWPTWAPKSLEGAPRLVSLDGAIYLRKGDGSVVRLVTNGHASTVFPRASITHLSPAATMASAHGLLWIGGFEGARSYGVDPALGRVTTVSVMEKLPFARGGPGAAWVLDDPSPSTVNDPFLAEVQLIGRHRTSYELQRLEP
jgi:streptogramin lyase